MFEKNKRTEMEKTGQKKEMKIESTIHNTTEPNIHVLQYVIFGKINGIYVMPNIVMSNNQT